MRNRNFRNNSAVTSDAIRHHISSYTLSTGSAAANAKKNYWNNPTVASDANLNGVNTLNQLSAKVNFEFDPPAVAPPCGVRSRQVCSPTPTPTLTPSPTPDTIEHIITDLSTYGITAYRDGAEPGRSNGQPWIESELYEVQEAVQHVANAFNLAVTGEDSGVSEQARSLFRNVMKQVDPEQDLEILRVNNDFEFGNEDACDGTSNAGCTSNGNAAIALYGAFALNEVWIEANFTIVHELGHRFDNQSATGEMIGLRKRMDGTNVILDCQGARVMGDSPLVSNVTDWQRGTRGWGTGSPPSLFQQDALEIVDTSGNNTIDEDEELSEAAADMFLNWVYRLLSDTSPPNEANRCTHPVLIGGWLGFRNITGTEDFDASLPGNARFVWMASMIDAIFADHDWQPD